MISIIIAFTLVPIQALSMSIVLLRTAFEMVYHLKDKKIKLSDVALKIVFLFFSFCALEVAGSQI